MTEQTPEPWDWTDPLNQRAGSLYAKIIVEIGHGGSRAQMQHIADALRAERVLTLEEAAWKAKNWEPTESDPGIWVNDEISGGRLLDEAASIVAAIRNPKPTEAVWQCACGWAGAVSALRPSPSSSLVCPNCGASGGLVKPPELKP